MLALGLFALGYLVANSGLGLSHAASTYYDNSKWPCCTDPTLKVGYRGSSGVLTTTTAANTMALGRNGWNDVAGVWLDFDYQGIDDSVYWTGSTCSLPSSAKVWMFAAWVEPDLANTGACPGNPRTKVRILFHQTTNWFVGQGTPASDEYDLWGVATHELGHATGWGGTHFSGSVLCPNDSTRHTMCGGPTIGTTWDRSLHTHDSHTFDNAY